VITLASDCLLFQTPSGESVPYSADMISIEVGGDNPPHFDAEFVDQATKAVFHYFKHDQARTTVTMGEFADALEKVLHGLAPAPETSGPPGSSDLAETDLRQLAVASGQGCDLFFFPLLRDELRQHLQKSPRVVRFHGLRGCVKQLAGVNRWSGRCRDLHGQIVDYLRQCLHAERSKASEISLLVE
jgi:hypothetical protein